MAWTNSKSIHQESPQYAYALAIFCGGIAFILPQAGVPISGWLAYGLLAAFFGSIWPHKALQWAGWICLPIGMLILVDAFMSWSIGGLLNNLVVLVKALTPALLGAHLGAKLSVRKIANRFVRINASGAAVATRDGSGVNGSAVPSKGVETSVARNGANGTFRTAESFARMQSANAALIKAAQEHDLGALRLLVAAGADVNTRSKDEWKPLATAALGTGGEMLSTLFGHQSIVDRGEDQGLTALMLATIEGHLEVVRALLEQRANVDAMNSEGWTALRFAVSMDETEILRILLDAGADPNIADRVGTSALMQAAGECIEGSLTVLLEAGANPHLKDQSGETALSIARKRGNAEIVRLLREAGARSRAVFKTPVHLLNEAHSVVAEQTHRVIRIRRDKYYGLIDKYDVALAGASLPCGWEETGRQGSEEECRDYASKNNIDEPSELGWWLVFSN